MKMNVLIQELPSQLEDAVRIARESELRLAEGFRNVLITGLGGSGIGGTLVSEWLGESLRAPIQVNKDYQLPAWVNEDTLLIASSYSGNTEETLSALNEGVKKGAHTVCVSSGGEVARVAEEKGLDHIAIPTDYPPRAAMGYSIVQLLRILSFHGSSDLGFEKLEKEILAASALLRKEQENGVSEKAKELAQKVHGSIPVIYAGTGYEGVAVRWRQQINENAKTLCWHHVLPEMNHNELVAWSKESGKRIAAIVLRNADDHERTSKRMDFCKDLVGDRAASWTELESKGKSRIQRALQHIQFGDWFSYHLAVLNEVDPVEVAIIDELKGRLKKV